MSVILTVGDEEIKEPVIIVVPEATPRPQLATKSSTPAMPATSVKVHLDYSCKDNSLLSHGITPGIDHVQVQVTVVIKVSPYLRAVIAEGIVQRLLRCLIIDEMPPRAFGC